MNHDRWGCDEQVLAEIGTERRQGLTLMGTPRMSWHQLCDVLQVSECQGFMAGYPTRRSRVPCHFQVIVLNAGCEYSCMIA